MRLNHPISIAYLRSHFGVIHSMGLYQSIMRYSIANTIISHSIFIALKSSVLCLIIHLSPQPLASMDHFTVSIVPPFPKCHIFGIIQYIDFSDHILSLNNM